MRHLHKGLVWVYVQYMNLKYLQLTVAFVGLACYLA